MKSIDLKIADKMREQAELMNELADTIDAAYSAAESHNRDGFDKYMYVTTLLGDKIDRVESRIKILKAMNKIANIIAYPFKM